MARPKAKRNGNASSSGSSARQSQTPTTAYQSASIIPVQSIHLDAPSADIECPKLRHVDCDELQFEDCTSQIHVSPIAKTFSENGFYPTLPFTYPNKGKKKAENGSDNSPPTHHHERSVSPAPDASLRGAKRPKIENGGSDDILILSTALRFDVLLHDDQHRAIGKRINAAAKESGQRRFRISHSPLDLRRAHENPVNLDSSEGNLIKQWIWVGERNSDPLVRLPVIQHADVGPSAKAHRLSNGPWLISLADLIASGFVRKVDESMETPLAFEATLDAVWDGMYGPYASFEGSFMLELQVKVSVNRAAAQGYFTFSSAVYAENFDRLIRFGFPDDEQEALIESQREVGAALIYGALRSSRLSDFDLLQPMSLDATLLPFQKRSVNFLLGREDKTITGKSESGETLLSAVEGVMAHDGVRRTGLFWRQLRDDFYYNAFAGSFTSKVSATRSGGASSGILAEEMGLGKTLEIFALALLNPDKDRSMEPAYYDEQLEVEVWPTKTTLIVAPEVLRQQWLDEAALHAPELRAFSYHGYKQATEKIPTDMAWTDFARQFDLMVVSFDTLRAELNVARKAPSRSRRFERKYERPRSLLIQLAFHRLVMDEVQLVGHSMAAETVSMIARNHSIAVSGTPLKQMSDLQSLFKFLRVPGPLASKPHWARLLSPNLAPSLVGVLGMLATRHTKAQVRNEMTLPKQTRILVPVRFTAIETAFYQDIYRRLLSALNFDPNAFPTRQEFLAHVRSIVGDDIAQLRSTLLALRQACTHPQIAGSGVRGTALASSQTIRSMDEVLTIMIDGSKAEHDSIWHSLIQKRIDRAVLLLQNKDKSERHDIAKAMLNVSLSEIEVRLSGLKHDVEKANKVGPLYKFDESEIENVGFGMNNDEGALQAIGDRKEGDGDPASHQTQVERDRRSEMMRKRMLRQRHVNALQQRMRNFFEQQHRSYHFLGNIYFQLGEKAKEQSGPSEKDSTSQEEGSNDSKTEQPDAEAPTKIMTDLKKSEDEAYDNAEVVRQELLKETRKFVDQAISSFQRQRIDFELNDLYSREEFGQGGLHSMIQLDKLAELQDVLDRHAEVLFDWRQQIWQRLQKPVNRIVSAEDENDDQYQENLDAQAESEALLEMYRVMLSEREYTLTGVRIEGALAMPQLYAQLEREVPQYERALRRSALEQIGGSALVPSRRAAIEEELPSEQELGVMRQQLDHFHKLDAEKNKVAISREARQAAERLRTQSRRAQPNHSQSAGIGIDEDGDPAQDLQPFETVLREMREKMQNNDGREEIALMRTAVDKIRSLITGQRQMLEKLKRESAYFSAIWNARAAYFKQMQELSDQVADIATDNIEGKNAAFEREEATLRRREEVCAGRLRYLRAIEEEEGLDEDHNAATSADGQMNGDAKGGASLSKTCPICTETLVRAVVLDTCGHTTCESCFKRWTAQRGQCPMCKTRANLRNIYHVTYSKQGKRRKVQTPGQQARALQRSRFNVIGDDVLQLIQSVPIRSSLGSKLDLLTRHLLYIEQTQRGSKSLIFTAFSRGISLVGDALRLNGVKFVTLDQGGARGGAIIDTFKNDGNINVLLLHSEAQSSGLNLVCAQNIFLLEPLVNHSLELQAIGRVHRIGQTRPTSVFCYEVNDTVEERIVELARLRGRSIFTLDNCESSDLKDSAELTAKMHQSQEGVRTQKGAREGEFVGQLDDVIECLFPSEDAEGQNEGEARDIGQASVSASQSSAHIDGGDGGQATHQEDETARMRRQRLEAFERRHNGNV